MNIHFSRPYDGSDELPRNSYGRLESYTIVDEGMKIVLNFDLIDAKWLDTELGNIPLERDRKGRFQSSGRSWLLNKKNSGENPFEYAPLYRLVLTEELKDLIEFGGLFHKFLRATLKETIEFAHDRWIEFQCLSTFFSGAIPAIVYPGLFGPALPAFTRGTFVTAHKHKQLTNLHDLNFFPNILTHQVKEAFAKSNSDGLAVYDVGQGNANALLESQHNVPTMYYDLGAGVYANQNTTPNDLRFCFTYKPTILLSHWDGDHWAGAYATKVDGKYPALKQKWIAPLQEVSTIHMAFSFDIWISGGQIEIYDAPVGTVEEIDNASGHKIRFWRGIGYDRNDSGIVIEVENKKEVGNPSWLLTGDCDYIYFPTAYVQKNQSAIVAPHHGADLRKKSPVPAPPSKGYARLIYSCGPENTHSGTSHPTKNGVKAHETAGWRHENLYFNNPGHSSPPGATIRATGFHFPHASRGGILVGWTTSPVISVAPCKGNCTTMPTKN